MKRRRALWSARASSTPRKGAFHDVCSIVVGGRGAR